MKSHGLSTREIVVYRLIANLENVAFLKFVLGFVKTSLSLTFQKIEN